MTDRELLEFAAKAYGLKHLEYLDDFADVEQSFYDNDSQEWWNPLTDDGDSLRLAVKLNFNVNVFEDMVVVDDVFGSGWTETICDDPYAATRRAITQAAAEIGKGIA